MGRLTDLLRGGKPTSMIRQAKRRKSDESAYLRILREEIELAEQRKLRHREPPA